MKKIFFVFLILISNNLFGQQTYPIQTILKGDSVVIYTTQQNEDIELIIENQRNRVSYYKNSVTEQEKVIDSLQLELKRYVTISDSLQKNSDSLQQFIETEFVDCRKLRNQYSETQKWLFNVAIDNAFIYYSFKNSTVIAIDLAPYEFGYRTRYGNIYLARRGPISQDELWRQRNRDKTEEIDNSWFEYFKENYRPKLIQYPFKIQIQP